MITRAQKLQRAFVKLWSTMLTEATVSNNLLVFFSPLGEAKTYV